MNPKQNSQKICKKCGNVNQQIDNLCKECGAQLQATGTKFEIAETLKGSLSGNIVFIGFFIGFMILISVAAVIKYPSQAILPIIIIWPIVIVFMVWVVRYLRGVSKIKEK